MIRIEIQIDERKAPPGKVAGRIEAQSWHKDPVTDEEVQIRDRILDFLKQIGAERGGAAGGRTLIGERNLP